jgi:hypothetical protein
MHLSRSRSRSRSHSRSRSRSPSRRSRSRSPSRKPRSPSSTRIRSPGPVGSVDGVSGPSSCEVQGLRDYTKLCGFGYTNAASKILDELSYNFDPVLREILSESEKLLSESEKLLKNHSSGSLWMDLYHLHYQISTYRNHGYVFVSDVKDTIFNISSVMMRIKEIRRLSACTVKEINA